MLLNMYFSPVNLSFTIGNVSDKNPKEKRKKKIFVLYTWDGVNYVLQKRSVEALDPSTSKYDLI